MKHVITLKTVALALMSTALTACISEDPSLEGISMAGGNAIAHNSALQIIDPWPVNVHDNDLVTPANRGSGDTAPAAGGQGTPVAETTPSQAEPTT